MPAAIRRHPEAMSLRFADLPYEVSEEFADNFVADFSPDDQVIGLEIVWSDSYRKGSEPALLAFGLFGAALAGLGWRYCKTESGVIATLHQQIFGMIEATGLGWHVSAEAPVGLKEAPPRLDLAIADGAGNLLLCAEVKQGKFRQDEVQEYAKFLRETVIPAHPGTIGVCVLIDDTGQGHRNPPVPPGRWIDWPEAKLPNGGHVWAHIAIIPPTGCVYPWLPEGFLPSRGAVNAPPPAVGVC